MKARVCSRARTCVLPGTRGQSAWLNPLAILGRQTSWAPQPCERRPTTGPRIGQLPNDISPRSYQSTLLGLREDFQRQSVAQNASLLISSDERKRDN